MGVKGSSNPRRSPNRVRTIPRNFRANSGWPFPAGWTARPGRTFPSHWGIPSRRSLHASRDAYVCHSSKANHHKYALLGLPTALSVALPKEKTLLTGCFVDNSHAILDSGLNELGSTKHVDDANVPEWKWTRPFMALLVNHPAYNTILLQLKKRPLSR